MSVSVYVSVSVSVSVRVHMCLCVLMEATVCVHFRELLILMHVFHSSLYHNPEIVLVIFFLMMKYVLK